MRAAAGASLLVPFAWIWVGAAEPVADPVAPGTRAMAARLAERAARVDPAALPYIVNERRAELLRVQLERPHPPARRLGLLFDYASELVNAGKLEQGLSAIQALQEEAEALHPENWRKHGGILLLVKAVAYLRQAEQENCVTGHNPASCLLPIRGQGVHRRREGASRALQVLSEVSTNDPGNLRARWLLNVAHMTLGSYPEQVPPRDLIPPAVFAPEYALPRFENVARQAGLDIYGLSGGAILDDFDRDGLLDLMVSAIGFADQLRFFRNEGGGGFAERTAQAGLTGETGGLNLLQADYDNDGWLDALVLRGGWLGSEGDFPLSLLRNDGDGTFTDVTVAAGLTHLAPTQTAAWLDYDGDGRLDLFVGNESTPGDVHPCELFHNQGDGTFTEVARAAGVDVVGFVKGVVSGDYDNDGRPDLYLSLGGADNYLLRNEGPPEEGRAGWRFTNVAASAGVTGPTASFPAAWFDYDNDGWLDLFVAGYGAMAEDTAADYVGLPSTAERGRLYHNRRDGSFDDVTRPAGLYRVLSAMGMNFGDLDNDGFLDLYVGTGNPDLSTLVPNRMFRNAGGRTFQDVTTAVDVGHLQKGHAVAFGDVDGDGDQDVFEQMGGAVQTDRAYSTLYENPGNAHRWLGLELVGVRSNRGAIGARVRVDLETGQGPRSVHRVVGSGGSFGASPLRLEIGLGAAKRILSVAIAWPASGRTQAITGLEPGRRYRVREDADEAQPVKLRSFRLGRSRG